MKVVKRDGSLQEFDNGKIVSALSKAFDACGYTISEDVCGGNIIDVSTLDEMASMVQRWDNITIEEIQDMVIETLEDYNYADVPKGGHKVALRIYRDMYGKQNPAVHR